MDIKTPDLINVLFTSFNAIFDKAYQAQRAESFWQKIATEIPSTSGSNKYGWLGEFPQAREWIGDRVVKGMNAQGYEIENREFESTVAVKATHIADDNIGIYKPRFQQMGYSAAGFPDALLAELINMGQAALCYDKQPFFSEEHPVYQYHNGKGDVTPVANLQEGDGPAWYLLDVRSPLKPFIFQNRKDPEFNVNDGPNSEPLWKRNQVEFGYDLRAAAGFGFWQQAYCSRAPLNSDNLDAAIAAMGAFTADGGRPLGIVPTMLMVPTALRADALKTVNVTTLEGGQSNHNYQAVDVEICSWLNASTPTASSSKTKSAK